MGANNQRRASLALSDAQIHGLIDGDCESYAQHTETAENSSEPECKYDAQLLSQCWGQNVIDNRTQLGKR